MHARHDSVQISTRRTRHRTTSSSTQSHAKQRHTNATQTHTSATPTRERTRQGNHRLRDLHQPLRQRLRPLPPLLLHLPLPPHLVKLEAGEARELRLAVSRGEMRVENRAGTGHLANRYCRHKQARYDQYPVWLGWLIWMGPIMPFSQICASYGRASLPRRLVTPLKPVSFIVDGTSSARGQYPSSIPPWPRSA